MKLTGQKKIILGVVIVAVLGVGWWLASPLFIDKQVSEPLPLSSGAASDKMKDGMEDKEMMEDEMMEDEMKDGMEDKEMMEDEMMEDEMKDGMEDKEMMEDEMKDGMEDKEMMDDEMKDEMVDLSFSGSFVDADSTHSASGDVFTVNTDDGVYLRFENFDATNGPDLYVYLAKSGEKTSEGIRLEKLKGNVGDQNYLLPEGVDLSEYDKVVIWCKAFDVDFGYAELSKS
ncbi:DM13 domain-containing protein [Chengkuizengella axinellae]|uniref:DM13 domain-containing protein n=1 Tax=Chengkuizengella axinellae TaxID=3064388 RepID=A0ABT9IX66_9BACL|nr:DM13 domain-containing protein [Chengkuizengella sp. 2205SS18-9]MDP5273707.1 DM13 domain-containing protein [Chengkuizengella sp. 2205SS18-9]